MRTANPALNAKTFSRLENYADGSRVMTLEGTVNKAGILLVLLVVSAGMVWHNFSKSDMPQEQLAAILPWMWTGLIGGLIFSFITIFKKSWAGVTAPAYAVLQGLFLGGISCFFELQFPGIVIQAVGLTFGTLFCLLAAYRSGLIRATENFKLGVVAATGAIGLMYLVSMILGFFGRSLPFIHSSGPIGIAVSVVIVAVAALNLVLDFDFIEQGSSAGAPKYMEWYAAFGLLITLVWLYMEILRLLSKLRSRR